MLLRFITPENILGNTASRLHEGELTSPLSFLYSYGFTLGEKQTNGFEFRRIHRDEHFSR